MKSEEEKIKEIMDNITKLIQENCKDYIGKPVDMKKIREKLLELVLDEE